MMSWYNITINSWGILCYYECKIKLSKSFSLTFATQFIFNFYSQMNTENFLFRHIGINEETQKEMLQNIDAENIRQLINETIPQNIHLKKSIDLPEPISEYEMLNHFRELGKKNVVSKNYIGFGYHPCITPSVIQRNILENPGWYTAYTPYQAEIAQGRLEALLNFQTMVVDLTGLPIANAALLDEGTAAAEAMYLFYQSMSKEKIAINANKFFISDQVFPQTIAVVKTKAEVLDIELVVGNLSEIIFDESFFGAIIQNCGKQGNIIDYQDFVSKAKEFGVKIAVGSDLFSLLFLKSPRELGADIAFGTTQRLGIPMGYGGPHAAYFSCLEEYKRFIPGRIIGITKDAHGNKAYRMALQTREQHIKRERATSNICTSQVLLAVMAGMYAVYHGPKGLKQIANSIHKKTVALENALLELGFTQENKFFFDTISINSSSFDRNKLKTWAEAEKINFNYFEENKVIISLNETTSNTDLQNIISVFEKLINKKSTANIDFSNDRFPTNLLRVGSVLPQEIFNKYTTETELMRYIKRLENKDLALNHSMIALGSCTMKLNAATELIPLSWAEFATIHPFAPKEQAAGYQEMIASLENYLSEITGFDATSVQPNSGAQGEYAGLMVIKAYHKSIGQNHRNIVLIPSSAHGTNPASAILAGMKVVVVKNTENGHIDFEDLKQKVAQHKENLSSLMVTYPSTYGFFDKEIKEITDLIHKNGGQVYMDGANMNAQVGLTSPAQIGADVCHLNLHKTFAIPHGGGGPGVGPICVAKHLSPFLPTHILIKTGGEKAHQSISSAPYGSASILIISYAYIRMLGSEGLKKSTEVAILSANYIKEKLGGYYQELYSNEQNRVAHELIIDCRPFKKMGIEVTDIAKRLMDYGFHAPTVSFPVAGTLMIEPTESESKEEIDRFIEALISIKKEIDEIAEGIANKQSNVLKNAPHTLAIVTSDIWNYNYSRQKAAYPLEWIKEKKFFATVSRVDDAYGDRNLICTCAPIESYNEMQG
jgi:glycine dehydrogenase